MFNKPSKKASGKRNTAHWRKVSGTSTAPRLCVYKSLNHIYALIIDDSKGDHGSSFYPEPEPRNLASRTNREAAKEVGGIRAKHVKRYY